LLDRIEPVVPFMTQARPSSGARRTAVLRRGGAENIRVLRVSQDDDDGVIRVDDDPIRRTAPLGVLSGAVVGVVTALPSG
jgi:hypothetical protein